jgi:short-subunit dehydrogenase
MWPFPIRKIETHFAGKTVWITGASSGIGAALAVELASRGAHLILSARRIDRLDQVRLKCAHPERHRVVPLDLSDPSRLAAAARTVLEKGPVDILVHNAGISQRSLALDTDLRLLRQLLEVNTLGTLALNGAVVPSMVENGAGQVVVITSVLGKVGIPMRSAYAASKHALHGYFECLRAEVHRSGVSVTLVCPGFVSTEISLHALTADGRPHGKQSQEQLEGMSPELCARDIARAITRRRPEVLVGGTETWVVPLFRWFPSIFRRLMRRRAAGFGRRTA